MKKGKYYEQKTAEIVKKHNPQSQVLQNVRIVGKLSKISREVDVQLVKPSDYDHIIFECKDHKAKVDIQLVESLSTKLRDLDAKKAAIVSNSGFTKGAKNMADPLGIDLLSLVDTADPKIRTSVYMSNIVEDTYVENGAVKIEGIPNTGLPADIHGMLIKVGDAFATWQEILAKHWNTQEMKQNPEPGTHFLTTENAIVIDAQSKEAVVSVIDIRYTVKRRYYLRNLRLLDTQGIYNVQKGTLQTNSITTESIVVKDLSNPDIWKQIDEETAKSMVVPFRLACTTPISTT